MFSSKEDQVKKDAANAWENTKDSVAEFGRDVNNAARDVADSARDAVRGTKNDANDLMTSIRDLLDDKSSSSERKLDRIRDKVIGHYDDLKSVAQERFGEMYETGREKGRKVLDEQPVTALAVAIGAGALIGFLLSQYRGRDYD